MPIWKLEASTDDMPVVCTAIILRYLSMSTAVTMSEGDTAVASASESKFFTYDGPNPKLTYPLKVIYCDGKYLLLCDVIQHALYYLFDNHEQCE